MTVLDAEIFHLINSLPHNSAMDAAVVFFTRYPAIFLLSALAPFILRDKKEGLKVILLCILAVGLSDMTGNALKHIFARPRPFEALDGAVKLVAAHGGSFPSSHASNSFAFAMAAFLIIPRAGWPLFPIAFFVALSRVYAGVHYPSDVAFGAVWGIGCGYAAARAASYFRRLWSVDAYKASLYLSVTAVSILRLYYIGYGPLDLSPDEAHYWEWSRRPDLSYYSKGPLVAYLIWIGTALLGDNVFGVRVPAVVLSALGALVVYKTGERLYGKPIGLSSAALYMLIPIYSAYGILTTIDAPFTFFWILTFYLFAKAADETRERPAYGPWMLTGLSLGFGLLSKFTMAFFVFCALLYLSFDRKRRATLLRPEPYAGLGLGLLFLIPVIVWNFRHGWVTFRHTARLAESAAGLDFQSLAEFAGSQIAVVTPLVFVMMIYAVFSLRKKDDKGALMFWFSVPVMVYFLYKSSRGKVEANWAMTGYITGLFAFSEVYVKGFLNARPARKALITAAFMVAGFLFVFAHYTEEFGLKPSLDPTARLRGWKELGVEVSEIRKELKSEGPHFIFSDSYQTASELAFYVEGHPVTYCANFGRRMNQYDLWPGFEGLIGWNAVFVKIGEGPMPDALAGAFARYESRTLRAEGPGGLLRVYTVFTAYGFRGIEKAPPDRY